MRIAASACHVLQVRLEPRGARIVRTSVCVIGLLTLLGDVAYHKTKNIRAAILHPSRSDQGFLHKVPDQTGEVHRPQ